MYLPKYRLRKTCLGKCLKSRVSEAVRQRIWKIGLKNIPISMTAPLRNLLITVNVVPLEKVSFSNTQNPNSVC